MKKLLLVSTLFALIFYWARSSSFQETLWPGKPWAEKVAVEVHRGLDQMLTVMQREAKERLERKRL